MANKIETLRQMVLCSKDLMEPAYYFLDHFADNADFLNQSNKLKSKEEKNILKIIEPMLAHKFQIKLGQLAFKPMRFKATQFIHGVLSLPRYIIIMIYFEADIAGIFMRIHPGNKKNVDVIRVKGFKSEAPIKKPYGAKIVHPCDFQMH